MISLYMLPALKNRYLFVFYSIMKFLHYQETPPSPSKRCKFLTTTLKGAFYSCQNLKDALTSCHGLGGRRPSSSPEEEYVTSDFEDEQEVLLSIIKSRASEKLRHKPSLLTDSFSWVFSPTLQELYMTSWEFKLKEDKEDSEQEDYQTANSCFTNCSCAESRDAFFSVRSTLSRSSSFNELEFSDIFHRRTIFLEFCQCEGWPFGLCRKAVLLPPLPKSPSESWSWNKRAKIVKLKTIYT